jgi:hypothetical protein
VEVTVIDPDDGFGPNQPSPSRPPVALHPLETASQLSVTPVFTGTEIALAFSCVGLPARNVT